MSLCEKVIQAKSFIQKVAFHATVADSIELPSIDEEKIACLFVILEQEGLADEQISTIVTATTLIQMGLDIHDTVCSTVENKSDSCLLKQQLRILAGDYYSGLFYKLLAEQEMSKLIGALATAIMAINATKQELFEWEVRTPSVLFQKLMVVESKLLTTICQCFGCENWVPVIEQHFLRKQLLREEPSCFLNQANQTLWLAHHKQKLIKVEATHERVSFSELTKKG